MRKAAAKYGMMLAAVAVAAVVRWLLNPMLGESLPYFTFYFATLFAAWYGGLWPGVASVVLGIVCGDFLYAEPRFEFHLGGLVQQLDAARYGAVGLAISFICESLIRSQHLSEVRREHLRTTLASIGDAVITTDADGRVTMMNAVAETLTGWTSGEAAGQALDVIFNIINEHSRQRAENPAARALREGAIVGLANHTLLIAKDGTERPIDDSASPIRDEHGVLFGCVLVFRDITDRKKMEDDLRQVAADLSESNRRKDEFLATLAHELRNPLAPIRNGLAMMRLAGDKGETIEQARNIMERQLSQMVRLVDDLMDLSRINRGKIELRKEQVQLADVLNSAIEASRPVIEEMGHQLTVTIPHAADRRGSRPGATGPGVPEPAQQCREVQRARRPRVAHRRATGQRRGGFREGYRRRHPRRATRADLRDVHATRSVAGEVAERAGHWTEHREAAGG